MGIDIRNPGDEEIPTECQEVIIVPIYNKGEI